MTEGFVAQPDDASLRLGTVGRRFDIRTAARHTFRVRLARRAIVFGVPAFLVTIVALVLIRPFHLPVGFSLGKVRIEGTRIDVVTPRLSGYRADGTPYTVNASIGTQDLATPSLIEMQDVDAEFGMTDQTSSHVVASVGIYDSSTDNLRLNGAVHMRNSSGYDIRTSSAAVNFKTGDVVTEAGVHVTRNGADITADVMNVTDDGHKVTFTGGVHSIFRSGGIDMPDVAQSERR